MKQEQAKMDAFKAGQTVYTLHGEECEYVASVGGKHVVMKIYENDDGQPWVGSAESIVEAVFTTPPTQKLHAEVGELETKSQELRDQLSMLRNELFKAEREHKARMSELTRLEPLKHLQDVLDGLITHYVVYNEMYGGGWYGKLEILASEDAISCVNDYGRRAGELKLLSLFGDSKGNLAWRRNHYRDGSGSWVVCEPFPSEAQAIEHAKRLLLSRLTAKDTQDHHLKDIIENCERYGFDVPSEARERSLAYLRCAYETAVTKAREALSRAEEALSGIEPA